jgi:hypothetical protein
LGIKIPESMAWPNNHSPTSEGLITS